MTLSPDAQRLRDTMNNAIVNGLSNVVTMVMVPLMAFLFVQLWNGSQDIAVIKSELVEHQRLETTLQVLDSQLRTNASDIAVLKGEIPQIEQRLTISRAERNEAIKLLQDQINELRNKQKGSLQDGKGEINPDSREAGH
jgi:hypothetical protein